MKIHSIFDSLQGEGRFQGLPTKFVRLYGCNLACSYCDAENAVSGGRFYDTDVHILIEEVLNSRLNDICITGGEPFCQAEDLEKFADGIKNKRISIETNGSFDVSWLGRKYPDIFFSIDWKTPSSGNPCFNGSNLEFIKNGQGWIKFVVSSVEDLEFISENLKYLDKIEVFVSPVFEKGPEWFNVVQRFVSNNNGLRFQLQLHKILGIE